MTEKQLNVFTIGSKNQTTIPLLCIWNNFRLSIEEKGALEISHWLKTEQEIKNALGQNVKLSIISIE